MIHRETRTRQPKPLEVQEEERRQRAIDQFADYQIRPTTLRFTDRRTGRVDYVHGWNIIPSRKKSPGNYSSYVCLQDGRCSCPDSVRARQDAGEARARGCRSVETRHCKHFYLGTLWTERSTVTCTRCQATTSAAEVVDSAAGDTLCASCISAEVGPMVDEDPFADPFGPDPDESGTPEETTLETSRTRLARMVAESGLWPEEDF